MARILVIDADQDHANRLVNELRRYGHSATTAISPKEIHRDPATSLSGIEIVLLNMTADTQQDWDLLEDLCKSAAGIALGLRVLAVSKVYRGTGPRLKAEKLGAYFLYD
ncbi:MAG: hypothetical protein ABSH32_36075 [Bryobacteraceae bacterium]|jgi:DNA-binding NtrC family response regulator